MSKTIHLISNYHRSPMDNDNWYVSTTCTINALKALGFKVILHSPAKDLVAFVKEIKILLRKIRNNDVVYIISNDSFCYDKYALLKLFRPGIKVLWEIHGVEEELLWFRKSFIAHLTVVKNKILRFFYSRFVSGSFCLSEPLLKYSLRKLKIKNSFIISSVVNDGIFNKTNNNQGQRDNFIFGPFKSQKNFIVYWAGGEMYPWQSLDILEKVAKTVYKLDKKIIFSVVGTNLWHKFKFTENMVFYKRTTYEDNIKMASFSNVCLALYSNQIKAVTGYNFYFSPRKIIEFMSLGKPVIASRNMEINKIITNSINGYTTKNSPVEIANIIMLLKKNPKLALEIGVQAKKVVYSRYRIKNLTETYDTYFRQLNILKVASKT